MKKKALNLINWTTLAVSSLGLLLLLIDLGFPNQPALEYNLRLWIPEVLLALLILLSGRHILSWLLPKTKLLSRLLELLLGGFMLSILLFSTTSYFPEHFPALIFIGHKFSAYWAFFFMFLVEFSRRTSSLYRLSNNPANLFLASFGIIIMAGTGLLMLPNSAYEDISFIDALFTSTSAVCVTGLIVFDTGSFFTPFGQWIILGLIQIGGIGILTFTSFFGLFFRGGFSLQNQLFMKDVTATKTLAEVGGIVRTIVGFTFFIEALGVLLIFSQLEPQYSSLSNRLLFSVFHSVSAYCNAGFSTLENGLYELPFRFNYSLQMVIAALFIFGGLGFPIIFNFINYLRESAITIFHRMMRYKKKNRLPYHIHLHPKIVLITTTILLISGTLLFYYFEYNNTLAEHRGWGKLVVAFFGAATPRTAGFNTVDTSLLSLPAIMLVLLLMWIGASPGSTGGGIKTTSFFIGVLNFLSLARGKDRVEFGKREISNKSVRRAFAIISLSLIFISAGILLLTVLNPDLPFVAVVFECVSAYSTVGLSMGITASLSPASRIVIILLMFTGRVGALTLLVGMMRRITMLRYRYPNEELFIN